MPAGSKIIGIDLVPIRAIRNVVTMAEDITTQKCYTALTKEMDGRAVDLVRTLEPVHGATRWVAIALNTAQLAHVMRDPTGALRWCPKRWSSMGAGRVHAVGAYAARLPAGNRVPFERRHFHYQSFSLSGLQRTDLRVQPGVQAQRKHLHVRLQLSMCVRLCARSCLVELRPQNRKRLATVLQRFLWFAWTTRTPRLTHDCWTRNLPLKKLMAPRDPRTSSRNRNQSASAMDMKKATIRSTRNVR